EVEFLPNTGMFVGWSADGALDVQGTSLGVSLTSASSDPQPGDWYGVHIGTRAQQAYLEGVTIGYGGGSSSYPGNLDINAQATVLDSDLHHSERHGLYLRGAHAVSITGTELTDNGEFGLYASVADALGSDFADNVVSRNGAGPVRLYASDVARLLPSSVYGGNAIDDIVVFGGIVSEDSVWHDVGVPLNIPYSVFVQHPMQHPTLTIRDGVEMMFGPSGALWVGYSYPGELDIQGSPDSGQGVSLLSAQSAPEPGDWGGVTFGRYASASRIAGATLLHSGSSTAALSIGGSVAVSDSAVGNSGSQGIRVASTGSLSLVNSAIRDNEGVGVDMSDGSTLLAEEDNQYSGNDWPIRLSASIVRQLSTSSQFSGNDNDFIWAIGATIREDSTWHDLGVPYYVAGNTYVGDSTNSPVLTLEDGADLRFAATRGLYVGFTSPGDLVINGDRTDGSGVSLSSFSGAGPGTWFGVKLLGRTSNRSRLEGFELSEAGYGSSYPGGLYLNNASPTVRDCVIRDNERHGIYVFSPPQPLVLSDCTVRDTTSTNSSTLPDGDGLFVAGTGILTGLLMDDVSFTGNERYPASVPLAFVDDLEPESGGSKYTGNGIDLIRVAEARLVRRSSGTIRAFPICSPATY
ncbi:MAG: right-handed parallel beta-helix repeat-containing protein, partial [Myxococcota bacterium]